MNLFKPTKTLVVGIILGAFVWPMVKGRIPS